MTLEHGQISTWHLPLFSALLILLRASAKTFMRTILAARKDGGKRTGQMIFWWICGGEGGLSILFLRHHRTAPPPLFFCIWKLSYPSIICWIDYPFPIEWTWHFCQKSMVLRCINLFLVSQHCFFCLHVCLYAGITLFWLLLVCSKF